MVFQYTVTVMTPVRPGAKYGVRITRGAVQGQPGDARAVLVGTADDGPDACMDKIGRMVMADAIRRLGRG